MSNTKDKVDQIMSGGGNQDKEQKSEKDQGDGQVGL